MFDNFLVPPPRILAFEGDMKLRFVQPAFCADKIFTGNDVLVLWGLREFQEKQKKDAKPRKERKDKKNKQGPTQTTATDAAEALPSSLPRGDTRATVQTGRRGSEGLPRQPSTK